MVRKKYEIRIAAVQRECMRTGARACVCLCALDCACVGGYLDYTVADGVRLSLNATVFQVFPHLPAPDHPAAGCRPHLLETSLL